MHITTIETAEGVVRAHRTGCRDIARETGPLDASGPVGEFANRDDFEGAYNADFEEDEGFDIDYSYCLMNFPRH